MEEKDAGALERVLAPDARILPLPHLEGPVGWMERERMIREIVGSPERFVERIRDPVVLRVDGPLAHVWAPYDFWRDGEYSHCGTDAFLLVRSEEGWRIAVAAYTLQPPELCVPRPAPTGPGGAS